MPFRVDGLTYQAAMPHENNLTAFGCVGVYVIEMVKAIGVFGFTIECDGVGRGCIRPL